MDMNPQRVRTAQFSTVKKGLNPAEVQSFLQSVADELERAQNQATAMEARARAAVARLQELPNEAGSPAAQAPAAETAPEPDTGGADAPVVASVDQSETISRTLLLAQRTADTAVAEARAEAERLRAEAEAEVSRQLESSRELSENLVNEARVEARQVGEQERTAVEAEVNAMLARRDFLESDVDHLEQFLVDQRSRLRDAATQIIDLAERVPGGLGEVRRPLTSGAGEEAAVDPAPESAADPAVEADEGELRLPDIADDASEADEAELRLPDIADDVPPVVNPPADG